MSVNENVKIDEKTFSGKALNLKQKSFNSDIFMNFRLSKNVYFMYESYANFYKEIY